MSRPGLAYERPTRMAQALILCFSLAVVVMAGWLVMTVMFAHDAPTVAEEQPDVPPVATKAPPNIEDANAPPLSATARMPSQPGASPWPDTRSAEAVTRPSAPAAAGAAATTYATSAVAPSANDRAALDGAPIETGIDPREMVPLPLPRPRRTAAVPVPRPRPRADDQAVAQVPQERNFFDLLLGR